MTSKHQFTKFLLWLLYTIVLIVIILILFQRCEYKKLDAEAKDLLNQVIELENTLRKEKSINQKLSVELDAVLDSVSDLRFKIASQIENGKLKDKELEKWRNKYYKIENALRHYSLNLEAKDEELSNCDDLLNQCKQDALLLEEKNQELKSALKNTENPSAALIKEIESLSTLNRDISDQKDILQFIIGSLSDSLTRSRELIEAYHLELKGDSLYMDLQRRLSQPELVGLTLVSQDSAKEIIPNLILPLYRQAFKIYDKFDEPRKSSLDKKIGTIW